MTDFTMLKQAFRRAGLSRRTRQAKLLARNAIRLAATPTNEQRLPLGASKIGGHPDLPPGIAWPIWNGLPQSFIAQFYLPDLHPYDLDGLLPSDGMLWFFYDARQQTFGQSIKEAGAWQVFYQASNLTNLERVPAPITLPETSQFLACRLTASSEITLSQFPEIDLPDFDWSDNEQERYEKVQSMVCGTEDHTLPHHQLLGYPYTLQDDMRLQCEFVSRGLVDLTDPKSIANVDPQLMQSLSEPSMDWLLLLQIDTDERIHMQWASTGILYYWIKRADLQQRNFERTWLVLQSD